MRLLKNKTREELAHVATPVAVVAALLGCLALGARTLNAADGGGPMASGGGDAIGSLPFNSPPPENLTGGSTIPSITFEAPSLAAVQALVIDAWGDGYAEVVRLTPEGAVRVELQGQVNVLLDRSQLIDTQVIFGLDVSQGFAGGLGVITRDLHVLSTQTLPGAGDLNLPLGMLANSGMLDHGGLTLNSFSATKKHHRLEMSGSGGVVRLSSRE